MSRFPSKLILFGEHSIVYPGYRSVVLPLSNSSEVNISDSQSGNLEFISTGTRNLEFSAPLLALDNIGKEQTPENFVLKAVSVARERLAESEIEIKPIRIELSTDIPSGGFGSSASYGAAIIDSVLKCFGVTVGKEELSVLVNQTENFQHGKASGVDPATVIYNSPIIFINGVGIKSLEINQTFLNNLSKSITIVSAERGNVSAGEIIGKVRERFDSDRSSIENIFSQIETNIDEFLVSTRSKFNVQNFIKQINTNGTLLEELGVVSDPVLKLSKEIRGLGYGIKISGAGGMGENGSGAVICVGVPIEKLASLLQKYQSKAFKPVILAR